MAVTVLVDADPIPYAVGFSTEDVSRTDIIAERIETFLHENLYSQFDDPVEFKFYLGSQDKSNFRYKIYPEYKANRVSNKPRHFEYIRDYLFETVGAVEVFNWEVDDEVAYQHTVLDDTVIASQDKDLDQLVGIHYNYHSRKRMFYSVDEYEAMTWFYTQLLMGDNSDNIKGIYGIGPKTAAKKLAGLQEEQQFYEECLQTYFEHHHKEKDMILNAQLLWLMREPLAPDLSNLWKPPHARQ